MAYRRIETTPDWKTLIGSTVRLYRNLLTRSMTLQHQVKGQGWRVAGCVQSCLLEDVSLCVDLKKYAWIQQKNKRTVCAWSQGILVGAAATDLDLTPIALGYNPLVRPDFYHRQTGESLNLKCSHVAVIDNEVFASLDVLKVYNPAAAAAKIQSTWMDQPVTYPALKRRA